MMKPAPIFDYLRQVQHSFPAAGIEKQSPDMGTEFKNSSDKIKAKIEKQSPDMGTEIKSYS